jgi:hypothetical protein
MYIECELLLLHAYQSFAAQFTLLTGMSIYRFENGKSVVP